MTKFRKLNLPVPCQLRSTGENKFICVVTGTDSLFLNKELQICSFTNQIYFDSNDEALDAYEKYYYLHAKEPGY